MQYLLVEVEVVLSVKLWKQWEHVEKVEVEVEVEVEVVEVPVLLLVVAQGVQVLSSLCQQVEEAKVVVVVGKVEVEQVEVEHAKVQVEQGEQVEVVQVGVKQVGECGNQVEVGWRC